MGLSRKYQVARIVLCPLCDSKPPISNVVH